MKNWDSQDDDAECSLDADLEDAHYVCKNLNIPFKVVNFVKPYWHHVFSTMLLEYQSGITPNPDILCNKKIKFDAFYKYAMKDLRSDAIATGHYARIAQLPNGDVRLLRGIDTQKDQTFFLSQVEQVPLQNVIFPVGELKKSEVKSIASGIGLEKFAKKRESTGICFVGRTDFQVFINKYVEPQRGTFVDIDTGEVVGHHLGVHCWTLGQRCSIGGKKFPYYVARMCPSTHTILVAAGTNHPALFCSTFHTSAPHWICDWPVRPGESFTCLFKTQHPEEVTPCTVDQDSDLTLHVRLPEPRRAITPGQFAVFYSDEVCLGSAKITKLGPSLQDDISVGKINCRDTSLN
ncbi:mitochondrial tRNA-specific 2-thiouridylase 1-like isoform X2 [Ornithodoros turicata]